MEPTWSGDGVDLYLGDCLSILSTITHGVVDAIITDPPYGLGFRGCEWDENIPFWLTIARSISPLVMFTTAPTTMWDYPRPDWVNCWYREASNSRTSSGGFNHWSPILVYGKVKFMVDSIKLHAIQHAYPKGFPHPSPKPEALLSWLIENSTEEGDTILDPFMGSGTTGYVSACSKRKFIGIEINPDYFEVARYRISTAQPRLL